MMASFNIKTSEMENDSREQLLEAFTQIYEAYYKRVFKYICYRIDDQSMAEEICSQIFERIMIKYPSFSGNDKSFESWLFTIAKNTLNDYYRKKQRIFHFPLDYIMDKIAPKSSPDEYILTEENNAYLLQALKHLNERERALVSLKYGAELKNTEIAQLMDLSESNVSVILCRSLKKLKKILVSGGFRYE